MVERMVELAKTSPVVLKGGLGRFAGSVSWGIDVHAATQCPAGCEPFDDVLPVTWPANSDAMPKATK